MVFWKLDIVVKEAGAVDAALVVNLASIQGKTLVTKVLEPSTHDKIAVSCYQILQRKILKYMPHCQRKKLEAVPVQALAATNLEMG